MKKLSDCCHVEIKTHSVDEGKSYFICTKCEMACDFYLDQQLDKEELELQESIEKNEWLIVEAFGGIKVKCHKSCK